MTMLLVPVAVDVLVQRSAAGTWAETRMREPHTPPDGIPGQRQRLLPDPFSDLPAARPPGAYLRWALADGLTELPLPAPGLPARFLPVPCRWLILRLSGPHTPKRRLDGFLLPNVHDPTSQVIPDILSLATPVPIGSAGRPLTTAGFGDLGWSAYFDNVGNRLGFYDPLAGIAGPVAYLVCGWYTHANLDPLTPAAGQPLTETGFRDRLAALGWYAEGPVPAPIPTASLYHGGAVSIAWPGTTWTGDGDGTLSAETGGAPDGETIDVALGDTIAAALARLQAQHDDPQELPRLIEALLQRALGELAQPDGQARVDAVLHRTRFGDVPQRPVQDTIYTPPELLADTDALAAPSATPDGAAVTGGMLDAVAAVSPDAAGVPTRAGVAEDGHEEVGALQVVERSRPRLFHPIDPSLVLKGARRSYRHGGDGRFDARGRLRCRYSGQTVTALGAPGQPPPRGADVLPAWQVAEMPAELTTLLDELASLDPGSAPDLALGPQPSPHATARAAWWTTWDRSDPTTPPPDPPPWNLTGTEPSPLALTPPSRPWIPLHLEWRAAWHPSPRGAHDWPLGELDYQLPPDARRGTQPHTLTGRGMLTPAPAALLAGAADGLEQSLRTVSPATAVQLTSGLDTTPTGNPRGLAEALADADLLSGSFQGLIDRVRGVPEGQLVEGTHAEPEPSYPVRPLRAGLLELTRLRVVDAFGQAVDLLGSSAGAPVDPARLKIHEDLAVPDQPGLAAQLPRFTSPARVLLRYTNPDGSEFEARPGQSPVCGYLAPSPFDGTLEFFDATGQGLGRLRTDPVTRTAWEENPGNPATLGRRPSQLIDNPTLGAIGDGVLTADTAAAAAGDVHRDSALGALLRLIDTTRWTVDLTGKSGDAHLALLLGQPVAVLRARLTLEVDDDLAAQEIEQTSIAVRLGSLARHDDGLLAWFADDDHGHIRTIDPAVAALAPSLDRPAEPGETPIDSPYVDTSGTLWAQAGRSIPLTLLVAPGADVLVTTGLLPQKALGTRREWMDGALARITPTLRFGPVLRDPRTTRLPVAPDVHGAWTWHRRPAPAAWAADPVVPATTDALLPELAPELSEGWLRVTLADEVTFTKRAVPLRIRFIDKPSPDAPIHRVGGLNPDGSVWPLTVDRAMQMVESGRFRFYVELESRQVDVVVDVDPSGRRFLRTVFDQTTENHLLSLPPFPKPTLPETIIVSGPSGPACERSASFVFSSEAGVSFECRLDGGAWEPSTSPKLYGELPDGRHVFEVRAIDAVGNVDPTPPNWTWMVDATPPQTTIDSRPAGTVRDQTATFGFSSPSQAEISFECRLDGGAWQPCNSPQNYDALLDGGHVFEVRAIDPCGNADPTPARSKWTIDTSAPDTNIASGPSGPACERSASFVFSSEAGVSFECRLDGGAWEPSTSPKLYGELPDGRHVFEVRAIDAVGNVDPTPPNWTWMVDATPPQTTIDSGPAGTVRDQTATFGFSSPSQAEISFECRLDGGAWQPCSSPQNYDALLDGGHVFEVRAIDPCGNVDPTPPTWEWAVDIVRPETIIASGPSGPACERSASFGFSASEASVSFECRLDGGAWEPCTSPQAYGELPDGRHVFEVRAIDAVGNVDPTPPNWAWEVDSTPPTRPTIDSGPESWVGFRSASFAFSSPQAPVTFECSLDDGAWEPSTSPKSYSELPDGEHRFNVRAIDPCGNRGWEAGWTWTVTPWSGTLELSPPDRIDWTVTPGAVGPDVVEFVLEAGPGITWRKVITIADGLGGSWDIATQDAQTSDSNGLYLYQLPQGTLTFRKARFPFSWMQHVTTLGNLVQACPPGSRTTFRWITD